MSKLTAKQLIINSSPDYWIWFNSWWNQDFSWEGLKYKTYQTGHFTGRLQPLRDVWLDEETNLLNFAGRQWTIFHLPEHDNAGNLSPKHPRWNSDDTVPNLKDYGTIWSEITQKTFAKRIIQRLKPDGQSGDLSIFSDKCKLTGIWFPHDRYNETDFDDFEADESPETDIVRNLFSKKHFRNLDEGIERELHVEAIWCHFPEKMNFSSISFRDSDFSNSIFLNPVLLQCIFGRDCFFENAVFIDSATFEFSKFTGVTSFDGSIFTGGPNFSYCNFQEVTGLRDIKFPRNSNFSNSKFSGKTKFHGSQFHESTNFTESTYEVPKASYAGKPMGEVMLSDVEECYRLLKQKLIAANHQSEAYKVGIAEQIARRRRWKLLLPSVWWHGRLSPKIHINRTFEGVPWWDSVLSKLYDLGSNYGESAIRPIYNLFLLFIIFSFVYSAVIYSEYDFCFNLMSESCNLYSGGAKLAGRNAIPPFTITSSPKFSLEEYGLTKLSEIKLFLIHIFQTLQLIISSTLVFLLVFAVKRRLQLKN